MYNKCIYIHIICIYNYVYAVISIISAPHPDGHGNDQLHLFQFALTMRNVMGPLATIAGAIGPHLEQRPRRGITRNGENQAVCGGMMEYYV